MPDLLLLVILFAAVLTPLATASAVDVVSFIFGEDPDRDLKDHEASQQAVRDLAPLTVAHVSSFSRRTDADADADAASASFVGAIVCDSTPELKGSQRNKAIREALEITSTIPVRNEEGLSCFEVFADLSLITGLLSEPRFDVVFLDGYELKVRVLKEDGEYSPILTSLAPPPSQLAGRDGLDGIVRDIPEALVAVACSDDIDTNVVAARFMAALDDLFKPASGTFQFLLERFEDYSGGEWETAFATALSTSAECDAGVGELVLEGSAWGRFTLSNFGRFAKQTSVEVRMPYETSTTNAIPYHQFVAC